MKTKSKFLTRSILLSSCHHAMNMLWDFGFGLSLGHFDSLRQSIAITILWKWGRYFHNPALHTYTYTHTCARIYMYMYTYIHRYVYRYWCAKHCRRHFHCQAWPMGPRAYWAQAIAQGARGKGSKAPVLAIGFPLSGFPIFYKVLWP